MPVHVVKRGTKFRVVEAATGKIVKSSGGKASDGGGHRSRAEAQRQANAINMAKHNK